MPEDGPKPTQQPDPQDYLRIFGFFNEIGIISQLSRALFEARLPDGVTVAHFSVLNHLVRVEDGRTPLEIARAFQVPKTTMTHTLAGLEARGLVAMKPNPRDGRSKCVWLTDAGRSFRDRAQHDLVADLQPLAAKLDLAEMMAIVPALERVRKVLDENRDPV